MTIDHTLIQTAGRIAADLFSQQTAAEIAALKAHFGAAYSEIHIISELTTKLVLRLAGVRVTSDLRTLNPVDALVYDAERVYRARH